MQEGKGLEGQCSLSTNSNYYNPFSGASDVRAGDQVLVSSDQHPEQLARTHFERNIHEMFLREGGGVAFGLDADFLVAGSVGNGGGRDDEDGVVTVRFECFELRRGGQAFGFGHSEVISRPCRIKSILEHVIKRKKAFLLLRTFHVISKLRRHGPKHSIPICGRDSCQIIFVNTFNQLRNRLDRAS